MTGPVTLGEGRSGGEKSPGSSLVDPKYSFAEYKTAEYNYGQALNP
jgi:hypothetical protein